MCLIRHQISVGYEQIQLPLVSASLVAAEGIKITLSTPKSVREGQAGEAVRAGRSSGRRGRGMKGRDEIGEGSGMQGC